MLLILKPLDNIVLIVAIALLVLPTAIYLLASVHR